MKNSFKTEQENFWAGEFGNAYIERSQSAAQLTANLHLFARALAHMQPVDSMIEFGANVGMNLRALKTLFPALQQSAIEINANAVAQLRTLDLANVFHSSILDYQPLQTFDLVLIKGVLIHISPDALPLVYDLLYQSSRRYIFLCEYFNPTPVEVSYRGHAGRLFKRDFAGELLDRFPDLRLADYGFVYRRDPLMPNDDANWFLLEKIK